METKPQIIEYNFNLIPSEPKKLRQWVCWHFSYKNENGEGKWTKPPLHPIRLYPASHSKPQDWGTYEEAERTYFEDEKGRVDGVGFVLTESDPFCAIDLDHCITSEGKIEPWAKIIIEQFNSYSERSPIDGIRILLKGKIPDGGRKNGNVEVYCNSRYITVTGVHLEGTPTTIEDRQGILTKFYEEHFKDSSQKKAIEIEFSSEDWAKAKKLISRNQSIMLHLLSPKEGDRSGHDWRLACLCIENGIIDPAIIYSILLNNPFGKAQHYPKTKEYIEDIISRCLVQFKDKIDSLKNKGSLLHESAIIEASHFIEFPIPQKRKILNPWLYEQSIHLISGWRGTGKTWLGLSLFDTITRGETLGPWGTETPVPALYLDGEMAGFDVQDRVKQLNLSSKTQRKAPLYIYSDAYANSLGIPRASLLKPKWREFIKNYLVEGGVKLFGVDNISSLAPGSDENSKFDWDPINQWLLEMRFLGIATILFHHTGKEGTQRGTSAREDNVDCSIVLQRPHDYMPEQGAKFIVKFKKSRVPMKDLALMADVEFILTEVDGRLQWVWGPVKRKNQIEILRMIDEGVKQDDIAKSLGVDKGYVSRVKIKAIKDGHLTDKGKLTPTGLRVVNSVGTDDEI